MGPFCVSRMRLKLLLERVLPSTTHASTKLLSINLDEALELDCREVVRRVGKTSGYARKQRFGDWYVVRHWSIDPGEGSDDV